MSKISTACPLTESRTSDPYGDVGTIREDSEKQYRFVKNGEASTALTLGQACCHDFSAGILAHQTVKIPVTATLSAMAGIVMATNGIAAGAYGWIQILGPNPSVSVIGATTGGADVAAFSYMKAANAVANLVLDGTTSPIYGRNVQMMATVGTTTTPAAGYKAAFIRCLQ